MVPHIGLDSHRLCRNLRNSSRPRQYLRLQTNRGDMESHAFAWRYVPESINKVPGALRFQHHHRRVYLGTSDTHYRTTTDAAETKDHCVRHVRDGRIVSYSSCCRETLY
jgi:hypothetical protein